MPVFICSLMFRNNFTHYRALQKKKNSFKINTYKMLYFNVAHSKKKKKKKYHS